MFSTLVFSNWKCLVLEIMKLVSNPHYVQERETSQFYKTILKASNGYRRLDCKLETYPWISFACGIEETNSLSQVSQTGNFPLHLFLCTKSFEITFLSFLSNYLALGQLVLALESPNLPINLMEKVLYFLIYLFLLISDSIL